MNKDNEDNKKEGDKNEGKVKNKVEKNNKGEIFG